MMAENRDPNPQDSYLTKLNTLLPAEVTGLYLFIHGLANYNMDYFPYLLGFALIISILVYLISPELLKVKDPLARLLYVITFLLWVAAIESASLDAILHWIPFSFVLAGSTAIWTFALPFIFTALKTGSSA
jgi:hypothetical protein